MNPLFILAQAAPGEGEVNTVPSMSWLPEAYSTFAHDWVDKPFWFINYVCFFFLIVITALMILFLVKYRRKDESEPIGTGANHNLILEIGWTIPPLILVLIMFAWGFRGAMALATVPPGAYEVNVTAQRWNWDFRYHNQVSSNELHCWVGQPIKLVMRSTDVLHSFFVPVFRTKVDIVPGRYSEGWFTPTEPGTFRLFCTEYCGTDHWNMKTVCVVHPTREAFDAWLVTADGIPAPFVAPDSPEDKSQWNYVGWGSELYTSKGCASCHLVEGDEEYAIGPNWKKSAELYHNNGQRELTGGGSVPVTTEYLRESILQPQAKLAAGGNGLMPYKKLTDDQVDALIAYIKSLHQN